MNTPFAVEFDCPELGSDPHSPHAPVGFVVLNCDLTHFRLWRWLEVTHTMPKINICTHASI